MPALSDLIVPQAQADVVTNTVAFLALAGMPTTSWQTGSVPVQLVQEQSQALASLSNTIANTAKGGLLSTATGAWLDLKAKSDYGLTRKPGIASQVAAILTDTGGGPFTISVAQLIATTPTGVQFQNTTGGTLTKNGTLAVTFQAVSQGAGGNIADGTLTILNTPLPGVRINNPIPSGGGTSLLVQGADTELDSSLVLRCQGRWPGLGGGATAPVYKATALGSTSAVTRVNVLEATWISGGAITYSPSSMTNVVTGGASGTQGGNVTVFCAGPSVGSGATDLQKVALAVDGVRPLGVAVWVQAAATTTVSIVGTITVKASQLLAAQSAFSGALSAYSQALAIGDTVYKSRLIALFQDLPGVVNFAMSSPSGDTALGASQVAAFTSNITWQTA